MTLIVSDNSPLNLLVRLGAADLLPDLFTTVVIPPEVAAEMAHPNAPPAVGAFIAAPPAWLATQTPTTPLPLPHLDRGEAAAISLAVIGAVGVLERAANAGLISDLATVHADVRGLRFYVSDAILKASLARHLAHRAAQTKGTP